MRWKGRVWKGEFRLRKGTHRQSYKAVYRIFFKLSLRYGNQALQLAHKMPKSRWLPLQDFLRA